MATIVSQGRRAFAGIVAGAVAGGIALAFGVPLIVEFLYRTEIPLLRQVLSGRDAIPLGEYLSDWQGRSRILLAGLSAVTALLLLVSLGPVQALIDQLIGRPPPPGTTVPRAGMTRARWLLVNATIVAIVGAHLLELLVPGDRWPFSPYAMYASKHGPSITWRSVYGVRDGREFRLRDPRAFAPIGDARLSYSFATRLPRTWTVVPPQDSMLRAVASLYERGRVAGDHAGAPLSAIRLYDDTWSLRRDLANMDAPDQHVLLREVLLDD